MSNLSDIATEHLNIPDQQMSVNVSTSTKTDQSEADLGRDHLDVTRGESLGSKSVNLDDMSKTNEMSNNISNIVSTGTSGNVAMSETFKVKIFFLNLTYMRK